MKFGRCWYDPYWVAWTQQDTLDSPLDPTNGNRYAYASRRGPVQLPQTQAASRSCAADLR